jgi:hypothetical protein
MTMDFTARTGEDFPHPDPDGAQFAPVPVYARTGKKVRRRPSPEEAAARPDSPAAGVAKAALIAIPVALIALGGVAYYALRSNDGGFAEMTPGARDRLTVAAAPAVMAPVAAPPVTPAPAPAAAPLAPAATGPTVTSSVETTGLAATMPAVRHERPARVAAAARARPAARTDSSSAASASTTGEDASAVAPAPYSTTAAGVEPASPGVPVNPAPLTIPPAPVTPNASSATP